MPRVLIAGCGYLGQAVADSFGDSWDVEGWTKSSESAAQVSTKPYKVRGSFPGSFLKEIVIIGSNKHEVVKVNEIPFTSDEDFAKNADALV